MAARALDFARAHPSTDASYTALVAKLQERLARADTLAMQQREGGTGEHASILHRKTVRKTLERVQIRHLIRVAEMASKNNPELAAVFVRPKPGSPNRVFITAAKSILAAAVAQKELFTSLGLGDTFLDELTQAIAQFDQETEGAHTGRRDHVGAAAELTVVADECVKLSALLDGLYQIRFRNDPESLAAWESSKNVVGPFRGKAQDPAVPTPAPNPADIASSAAPRKDVTADPKQSEAA